MQLECKVYCTKLYLSSSTSFIWSYIFFWISSDLSFNATDWARSPKSWFAWNWRCLNFAPIIILSMIYARSTTFSITFILGKMKFPVFPDIFTDFQIPCVFPDIKYNFKIPWFLPAGIFFSHFPCFPCFSLSVGTLSRLREFDSVAQVMWETPSLLVNHVKCKPRSCSNPLSCFRYFKALQLDIMAHTSSLKLVIISYNVALLCLI